MFAHAVCGNGGFFQRELLLQFMCKECWNSLRAGYESLREWKNQKNMNYLVNVYLKARNGDVAVAAVKRKAETGTARYIELLSDVTVKRYFAALLLWPFLHCNYYAIPNIDIQNVFIIHNALLIIVQGNEAQNVEGAVMSRTLAFFGSWGEHAA